MQIHFDTSDDEPTAPNSRYPNQISILSLSLQPNPTTQTQHFGGFSLLHVRRRMDRGAVIFTRQVQTSVSFAPDAQTGLSIDLARKLKPNHILVGFDLAASLQGLAVHAMAVDPAGFTPAMIALCHATRRTPPIEIIDLCKNNDVNEAWIDWMAGPSVNFDFQDHQRAVAAKDEAALGTFLETRNLAMWLTLVNFTLPVSEQLIAVMGLGPG